MNEYEKQKIIEECNERSRERMRAESVFWPVFLLSLPITYPMCWIISQVSKRPFIKGGFQLGGWEYFYVPLLLSFGVASMWWLAHHREINK